MCKREGIPFSRLIIVRFSRSVIYYGLSTFLPLYWIGVLRQLEAAAGTILTIFNVVGTLSNLIGGWLADRFGAIRIIRIVFGLLLPTLLIFAAVRNVLAATLLLIPIAMLLFIPFSPMVVLGQKYLSRRTGFSAGVTLGLGVSVGGILVPVLGWFADGHGLSSTISLIAYLPVLATIMAYTLSDPLYDRFTQSQTLER